MCGRYALGVRMAFVRRRLQEQGMQVDEAPEDEDVRETFNFAPGSFGAVYRADVPDRGYDAAEEQDTAAENLQEMSQGNVDGKEVDDDKNLRYKLQSMKWGLIPFWTKRQPDYGSLMRTINCRDDSLIEDRGMWTSMKRRKRCVVVCQGFYEWLKKGPGGKERIPHFIKRKDGNLMCFAGLWDCVSYEDSEEKLYTYTVITTSSNPYLKFLHDRMPVILEPNSEAMKTWLDPTRTTWSKELQSILKPYEGELECYPVSKEVGKVGNNSPDFLIPVNSKENKSNIANFFANAKKKDGEPGVKIEGEETKGLADTVEHKVMKDEEHRITQESAVPIPKIKREHTPEDPSDRTEESLKKQKIQSTTPPSLKKTIEPDSISKQQAISPGKRTRSAKHNSKLLKKADAKKSTHGSQRITKFFQK